MGKRLSDLNLGESGPPRRDDLGVARQHADEALAELEAMLDTDTYNFAWGTLQDLKITIRERGQVTQGQLDAIANIKRGGDQQQERLEGWHRHERRTGRRYEGWEPSR